MQTHILRVRTKTHWLGARWTPDDSGKSIRKFERDQKGLWKIDASHWLWAMSEAATYNGLPRKWADKVRLPAAIPLPTLRLFIRKYRIGENPKEKQAVHEAISPNTIITFPIYAFDLEESTGSPGATKEEIYKVFSVIGEIIGLSPWGNSYGYGRFVVLPSQ